MAFELGDDLKFKLTIMGVDDQGNQVPAQLDAPAVWASSDPTVLSADTDPSDASGATGAFVTTGKLGPVTLSATGTGNAGATSLDTNFEVDVIPTAEVGFALVPSTPEKR